MDLAEFTRSHYLRAPGVMWLLGAGTSAAAGIPTADQMIWEFKRVLFATTQGIPSQNLNLGDPSVRDRIQAHFDGIGGFPERDADEEYSHYFEAAWPQAGDRRSYIERAIERGRPTYGHLCLAVLAALKKVSIVWSTNFDRLYEDACSRVLGSTTALTTATLDSAAIAVRAVAENRWPLYAKIHGDYQSEQLKNTPGELQSQDARLRGSLINSSSAHGLAVVGFSGRDQSVMDALFSALDQPTPFPQGLFWFRRHSDQPRGQVLALLDAAKAKGVEAHLIECGSFDELMGQVILPFELPDDLRGNLDAFRKRQWKSPFSLPGRGQGWPILRLNALRVEDFPRVVRRVVCEIGGTKEVRAAIVGADADVVAVRRRDGVVGFGSDADMRRVFDRYHIAEFDLGAIDVARLARSSSDLGLLYDALTQALARTCGLQPQRVHREHTLVVTSETPSSPGLDLLKSTVQSPFGLISSMKLRWAEGVRLRLEWHFEDLWLIYEPYVWVEAADELSSRELRKEFARKRTERRWNPVSNDLFEAWSQILTPSPATLLGLGEGEGIDAIFDFGAKNAFAREDRSR